MLHVHRSDRADGLIAALRDLLAEPPADPFAREVVSVPTRGMERWLTQRLSLSLGICANVDFPFPRRLTGDAVAAASGIEPDEDPWLPERMVWPLLDVVDEALAEPWLEPLAAPLTANRARRFAAVRHLANLFDRYALHRPELVRGWAAGEDGHWQAELWRRLNARILEPDPAARGRERLRAAARASRSSPSCPQRFSLFGLTRLPAGQLQVLRALAEHRDVHLFLLHPSPALWEKIAARAPRVTRRADDETARLPENRLLASWGQDSRELQLVIGPDADVARAPGRAPAGTLLARVQAAVREDRPLEPGETDASIQVHACHGRARQVEVVRDAILHLLEADPTLEPRDVVVMCPDIEAFAPLIQATFGAGESADDEDDELPAEDRPPDLRVRLADRSLRQTNPVLGVVARLLELAGQRLTASQVLDLTDREPVRRRFRLDDDDVARLEDWVADSGVRWGLDAEHRAPFKLAELPAGTWRFGLDRLLLGVTMTEDDQRLFGGVLPLDDVESGAIDLAGRLAELVARLHAAVDALSTPRTVPEWAAALAEAADALTSTAQRDAWQRAELQRLLDDVVNEAAGHAGVLEPAEVRALLAERLQGRPTRANFRTGHLTICTLVPMRSVPHRVVCLLGLDDGTFPRKAPRDGDDLMLADPHVGERDSRTEDRQLLLDALLAATDRLIITYTGHDERTNLARPPAVPVGELLDVVGRGVVREHPLQPFDPRNFVAGEPWSFDRVLLEGARAMAGERAATPPFLRAPLPAREPGPLELDDLVRFVEHPARAFLRQRLGIRVGDWDDEVGDGLPVELNALEQWGVGQRLLDALMRGADGRVAIRAEIARGKLPPGQLGRPVVQEIWQDVDEIAKAAHALIGAAPEPGSVDVKLDLADRRLTGTVAGVRGALLTTVTYSKVNPRHRLGAWVRFLALAATRRLRGGDDRPCPDVRAPPGAAHGGPPARARAQRRTGATRGADRPLRPRDARAAADRLPHLGRLRGRRQRARRVGVGPLPEGGPGRRARADLRPAVSRSRRCSRRPPGPDELWDPGEPSRFGQYALRLWGGLLAHEAVTDQ